VDQSQDLPLKNQERRNIVRKIRAAELSKVILEDKQVKKEEQLLLLGMKKVKNSQ
jgi:hypothetical protein